MRRIMVALSLTLLFTAIQLSHAFAQVWGRIEFPARCLISLEEGTVEAWVLFEFDPAEPVGPEWRGTGAWFNFVVPKSKLDLGAGMSIITGLKKSSCLMRVGFDIDGKEVPHPVVPDCTLFGKGKWHHVAATWHDGRYLRVYFDGKEVAAQSFPWSIVRDIPPTARIVIGHVGYIRHNLLAVDEIRVSSIARKPEDLGCHSIPIQPDPYTLFLENFERISEEGKKRFTSPEVIATTGVPAEYEIIGGRIIQGRVGKGFAFDGRKEK